MIFIDDAGTGCPIGVPILMAYRQETKEKAVAFLTQGTSIIDAGWQILTSLSPKKDEKIAVCRGNKMKGLIDKLVREGFNATAEKIVGEAQDVIENEFLQQLYGLGLSKEITLENDNYQKFHCDIINDMFLHPELLQHVSHHYKNTRAITEVFRKVARLVNEFPNLYERLKNTSSDEKI